MLAIKYDKEEHNEAFDARVDLQGLGHL